MALWRLLLAGHHVLASPPAGKPTSPSTNCPPPCAYSCPLLLLLPLQCLILSGNFLIEHFCLITIMFSLSCTFLFIGSSSPSPPKFLFKERFLIVVTRMARLGILSKRQWIHIGESSGSTARQILNSSVAYHSLNLKNAAEYFL